MTSKELQSKFDQELANAESLDQVESIRVEFLGKKGFVTDLLKSIASLSVEEKKTFGKEVNELKSSFASKITVKKDELELAELNKAIANEKIDVTLPPRANTKFGKIHPISKVMLDLKKIFASMGFDFVDGPDVEDDWHNFEALNFTEYHPARQMHDTFYTDQDGLLLRTHTSNVQIRHMENLKPPHRVITMGRTYRSDYDATHTPMFHQIEGLLVDKNITIGHMINCLETFLSSFFEVDHLPIRLRPSYFPFTEPSAEVDVKCDRSSKKEIKFGVGEDWLEILGCGMVHPNVLKNVGIDPDEYQGFAFGAGLERLAMLKYNIPDLRTFFEGDARWSEHYGF